VTAGGETLAWLGCAGARVGVPPSAGIPSRGAGALVPDGTVPLFVAVPSRAAWPGSATILGTAAPDRRAMAWTPSD